MKHSFKIKFKNVDKKEHYNSPKKEQCLILGAQTTNSNLIFRTRECQKSSADRQEDCLKYQF